MESMSINPAAAAIGSRLVDVAAGGLGSGAAALPSLTALAPAGAEEVSMQAAMSFAAEAEAFLALNAAAQEELARAGLAVTEIARMYSQVDGEAAGSLVAGGSRFAGQAFAGGAGANVAAGLLRAETLPGAGGLAARTPLMANLIEGVAASSPATTVPAAANAASTVLGAGAAPLSSIGQFASMGGAAGGGTAGVPTSLAGEEESTGDESEDPGQQPGEELV
jgi:PE family